MVIVNAAKVLIYWISLCVPIYSITKDEFMAIKTDKFKGHSYEVMYGLFLIPLSNEYKEKSKTVKMLEIGLGCDMPYGAGKSVPLWRTLFGNDSNIWIAEYDTACANKFAKENNDIHIVTGDQGNFDDLKKWVDTSGGSFDVIIDDGGHKNDQILNSFNMLWKTLNPGGYYFIEDLHVGRLDWWADPKLDYAFSDIIQLWIDQLLIGEEDKISDHAPHAANIRKRRRKHPLPSGVNWIFCQRESCVLQKCTNDAKMCADVKLRSPAT
eukprot:gene7611-10362_t